MFDNFTFHDIDEVKSSPEKKNPENSHTSARTLALLRFKIDYIKFD